MYLCEAGFSHTQPRKYLVTNQTIMFPVLTSKMVNVIILNQHKQKLLGILKPKKWIMEGFK